jgi:uncharacterized protein (TIGR01777 family)
MIKNVLITGGTGLIGKALVSRLNHLGYNIVLLSRKKVNKIDDVKTECIIWDSEYPHDIRDDVERAFKGESYSIINLAGYPIAQSRWSEDIKTKIINSRVNGTEYLANDLCGDNSKVSLFISASAVGYYGNVSKKVAENGSKGVGFLSDVCEKWENATKSSKVDTKIIRIGVVLSENGGALKKMMLPYKLFVGGPIGSGQQYVPWIHIEDIVKAIVYILETTPKEDVFNLVAPDAVYMATFSKALAKIMRRPNLLPVPSFILKIIMGEMASMVLEGQNVYPDNLINAGYEFRFDALGEALGEIIKGD